MILRFFLGFTPIAVLQGSCINLLWVYWFYHIIFFGDTAFEFLSKGKFISGEKNLAFHGISAVLIFLVQIKYI
jgi:hypothetical protein